MDPLKSGAIFRVKNISVMRSPPAVASGPVAAVGSAPGAGGGGPAADAGSGGAKPDHTSIIKERFDQIYRATPLPASILFDGKALAGA